MAKNTKQMAQQMAQMISASKELRGTFLEDLFNTLAGENFTEPPQDVDLSCEKVIGEMNTLEKALNTLCKRYEKIGRKLLSKEVEDTLAINRIKGRLEITREFLWGSICDRFSIVEDFRLGIRKGFQVVIMDDKALTKAVVEGFFRLIEGEEMMQ